MIPNTTYRFLVEKLGDSDATQFVGNEGEVFYDPNQPLLKLSDGSTVGGIVIDSISEQDKTKLNSVVISDPTGIIGADVITNIVSLTQAEYDEIESPDPTTLYIITD